MIALRKWRPGPKSGPKMYPFGGGQVSENTMNSKGFGAFWPLGGDPFVAPFRKPEFQKSSGISRQPCGKYSFSLTANPSADPPELVGGGW